MDMVWWIIIGAILGISAALLELHFKKKREKRLENICEGVTTEVKKTIKRLDELNNKS